MSFLAQARTVVGFTVLRVLDLLVLCATVYTIKGLYELAEKIIQSFRLGEKVRK